MLILQLADMKGCNQTIMNISIRRIRTLQLADV